ncbi:MAG TPA: carboxypeptidase-like regulatory domain-containing protein, partial [Rhodanobacteraceae bacterium]|nr:carboxypeptidase-like regulatory domain-containing protein [Rhodanobacteraceae bacterium]
MTKNLHKLPRQGSPFQRKALALAIGGSITLAFAGGAFAQATTGTIHGTVPVAPNETIQISGTGGFNRTITVGPSGTYSLTLPVGIYTVSLLQNGSVVKTRQNVSPAAGGSVAVDFARTANAANVQTLSTVNVVATAIPSIDVTTTNMVTTTTAKQLEALPLSRSSGSIALLAPGVSAGAPMLNAGGMMGAGGGPLGSQLLVFGGASVAENAYYVDGMNTTDQLTGQGGITMPYGSLLQQQTFTSGYGAKYGRSIGGVINQIGKSGSNEWHFGARAIWEPSSWRSAPVNQYYDNPLYTQATLGDGFNPSQAAGQPRTIRSSDTSQLTVYDAYVSGPIIKNKLTFFLSAEQSLESGGIASTLAAGQKTFFHNHAPKIYAKINWNINENNQLSISGLQNSEKSWSS